MKYNLGTILTNKENGSRWTIVQIDKEIIAGNSLYSYIIRCNDIRRDITEQEIEKNFMLV